MVNEYKCAGYFCTCWAASENECACGADWTDPRVYKLQKRVVELEQLVSEAYFEGWQESNFKRNANREWDRSKAKFDLNKLRQALKGEE